MSSDKVKPPKTGVPVLGAYHGSNESISTLTCNGRSFPLIKYQIQNFDSLF